MKRLLSLWLPVVIWAGFIFYLSSIPNLKASQNVFLDEVLRNGAHLGTYAILYFLFFRALNFERKLKNFWLPFCLTSLYGLFDEIHQSFVPTRTFQIQDLIIDWSGATVGGLILWLKKS